MKSFFDLVAERDRYREALELVDVSLDPVVELCIKNWDDAESFADAVQGNISEASTAAKEALKGDE